MPAASQGRIYKANSCPNRMQTLGFLGTTDAQHAVVDATLRLKDLGDEEACAQAGIVIDLLFNLWEPIQQVQHFELRLPPQH